MKRLRIFCLGAQFGTETMVGVPLLLSSIQICLSATRLAAPSGAVFVLILPIYTALVSKSNSKYSSRILEEKNCLPKACLPIAFRPFPSFFVLSNHLATAKMLMFST